MRSGQRFWGQFCVTVKVAMIHVKILPNFGLNQNVIVNFLKKLSLFLATYLNKVHKI
jgi:hypothetical protein